MRIIENDKGLLIETALKELGINPHSLLDKDGAYEYPARAWIVNSKLIFYCGMTAAGEYLYGIFTDDIDIRYVINRIQNYRKRVREVWAATLFDPKCARNR